MIGDVPSTVLAYHPSTVLALFPRSSNRDTLRGAFGRFCFQKVLAAEYSTASTELERERERERERGGGESWHT